MSTLSDSASTMAPLLIANGGVQQYKTVIYRAVWSPTIVEEYNDRYAYLATCQESHLHFYRRKLDGGPLELMFAMAAKEEAEFFCCTWAGRSYGPVFLRNENPTREDVLEILLGQEPDVCTLPLLCAAGKSGPIRVVDITVKCQIATLVGHGSDVFDLKAHPNYEYILFSSSDDETIRVWSLRDFACLAILGGGPQSHIDSIVSIDIHPKGKWVVSGGMDRTVKLWEIGPGTATNDAMVEANKGRIKYFKTLKAQPIRVPLPCYSTHHVHVHVVDCVRFMGDLVLSKSIDNQIELWKPLLDSKKMISSGVKSARTFYFDESNHYFSTFSIDQTATYLAVGNATGKVYIWNMRSNVRQQFQVASCLVRAVAFGYNSLVATTDEGHVLQWLLQQPLDASNIVIKNARTEEEAEDILKAVTSARTFLG